MFVWLSGCAAYAKEQGMGGAGSELAEGGELKR